MLCEHPPRDGALPRVVRHFQQPLVQFRPGGLEAERHLQAAAHVERALGGGDTEMGGCVQLEHRGALPHVLDRERLQGGEVTRR